MCIHQSKEQNLQESGVSSTHTSQSGYLHWTEGIQTTFLGKYLKFSMLLQRSLATHLIFFPALAQVIVFIPRLGLLITALNVTLRKIV